MARSGHVEGLGACFRAGGSNVNVVRPISKRGVQGSSPEKNYFSCNLVILEGYLSCENIN